jgi:membrane protease YdiL (CAAX protease family)
VQAPGHAEILTLAAFPLGLAWAAVWEEIVFRGWLQPALDRWWQLRPQSPWSAAMRGGPVSPGNLLASLAFATVHMAFHPAWLWPAYLLASLALGVARERSGGVGLPMALHLAANLGWWAVLGQAA